MTDTLLPAALNDILQLVPVAVWLTLLVGGYTLARGQARILEQLLGLRRQLVGRPCQLTDDVIRARAKALDEQAGHGKG